MVNEPNSGNMPEALKKILFGGRSNPNQPVYSQEPNRPVYFPDQPLVNQPLPSQQPVYHQPPLQYQQSQEYYAPPLNYNTPPAQEAQPVYAPRPINYPQATQQAPTQKQEYFSKEAMAKWLLVEKKQQKIDGIIGIIAGIIPIVLIIIIGPIGMGGGALLSAYFIYRLVNTNKDINYLKQNYRL